VTAAFIAIVLALAIGAAVSARLYSDHRLRQAILRRQSIKDQISEAERRHTERRALRRKHVRTTCDVLRMGG
jgi:hypothetical protein